jgi:hypothetical protein
MTVMRNGPPLAAACATASLARSSSKLVTSKASLDRRPERISAMSRAGAAPSATAFSIGIKHLFGERSVAEMRLQPLRSVAGPRIRQVSMASGDPNAFSTAAFMVCLRHIQGRPHRRHGAQRESESVAHVHAGPLGNVKKKVEPFPGSDSTQILPPWRSTIRLHNESPMPVPG